jgi:hypothetical protein
MVFPFLVSSLFPSTQPVISLFVPNSDFLILSPFVVQQCFALFLGVRKHKPKIFYVFLAAVINLTVNSFAYDNAHIFYYHHCDVRQERWIENPNFSFVAAWDKRQGFMTQASLLISPFSCALRWKPSLRWELWNLRFKYNCLRKLYSISYNTAH